MIPLALSIITFVAYVLFPSLFRPGFLGRFVALLFQFMVFVVPFHLAALAAFATFERPGLDDPLKGTNAEIMVWSNADNAQVVAKLTLRQYASLLFGYLCAIGIIFIIVYLFASNIDFRNTFGPAFQGVYLLALGSTLFFVFHYAVLSGYAITFLFDKVNGVGSRD